MKSHTQYTQLTLDAFRSSLSGLSKSNRWVVMGDTLPWAEIEKLYNSKLHNQLTGAGNKPARMVVGALIIKHKMNLSDEETILAIRENPYMQYMLGLSEFTDRPVFDSSLFVSIRKRLQTEDLNSFTLRLLSAEHPVQEGKDGKDEDSGSSGDGSFTDSQGRLHKGSIKIDATCCDAEVRYPTDVDLLEDGSRVINSYLVKICREASLACPSTYRKRCRIAYPDFIKKKKKSRTMVNGCKSLLLNGLSHDIRTFIRVVAVHGTRLLDGLGRYEKRTLRAIITMYHQQETMFSQGTNSIADRIVSIFQPHIRPIVRGKSKSPVEFGAKIGVSVVEGYTFIDNLSWDAYNEHADLRTQIELYRQRFGCLPSKVYADKIYMSRENRTLMKGQEIQAMGKPSGRPPKNPGQEYEKEMALAAGKRNEVEATFGTGKRVYRGNEIRAKLPETANCWIGMCYFAKNVMKFIKGFLHLLLEIGSWMKNPALESRKLECKAGFL